ncbi:hypothetical protein BH10ACT1_BH10ACT1_11890 [soil metagenome]
MASGAVQRLVGVYNADGTPLGELAYFIGARLGRAHCSLCDITHGTLRERPEWKSCRTGLPVPFETFHRNDQPEAVRALLAGVHPAVAAETGSGWVLLLGPDELKSCAASPEALVAALESAVRRRGLRWT